MVFFVIVWGDKCGVLGHLFGGMICVVSGKCVCRVKGGVVGFVCG